MTPIRHAIWILAFLLQPVVAWSETPPDPPQNELHAMAEEVLNGQLVDIPIGRMTATHVSPTPQTICGHAILPPHGVSALAHAQKAGLVTFEIKGVPANRKLASLISELMMAVALHNIVRELVVTPTDAGRSADVTPRLPAAERIANCIRIAKGKFTAREMTIRPAHGASTTVNPQYRIVEGLYDARWSPEYRAMGSALSYPDQQRVGMLLHYDADSGRWKRITWQTKNLGTRAPMTFRADRFTFY